MIEGDASTKVKDHGLTNQGVAKEALRRHQHQGFPKLAVQLAAQQVEVVGWCRHVAYLCPTPTSSMHEQSPPGMQHTNQQWY